MKKHNGSSVIFLLALLVLSTNAFGQIIDTKTTHIVKDGESLHSITRDYLGTDILWKENWKLNPQVQNPHMLSIGQKLIIIKQRDIPAEKATMLEIINKVERKKNIGDWEKALKGDELNQKEGVRTFSKSSVLLKLNNASQFKILEFSQVFLQSRKTTLSGTDSATIEIIKGDAELSWDALDIQKAEIEIITGSTKLTPFIEKGKETALRTGLSENGSSVISVYKGDSNVESAGKHVAIPEGMGMKVKQGEAPPQPTPLLKAPLLSSMNINEFNYSNPVISWQKVPNAAGYLVEICEDIKCGVVKIQKKQKQTNWSISGLNEAGDFYWRVAAYSQDDIIGFRSKTSLLQITDASKDKEGPFIALEIIGKQKIIDNTITISPNTQLTVFSHDSKSGLKLLKFKWNNAEWQEWQNKPLSLPADVSKLTVEATDHLNQATSKEYIINYK